MTDKNEFVQPDPILGFLFRHARRPRNVYLFAIAGNLLLALIGIYYSFKFGPTRVAPLWESGQLLQSLSVGLLASPTIWAYALWQPLILRTILDSLESKGVIAKSVSMTQSQRHVKISLRELVRVSVTRRLWSILSLAAGIFGVWIFFQFVVPAETAAQHGRSSVFYSFAAIKLLYMLFFGSHIYLVALTALRTLASISAFSRFFSSPGSISQISIFDADHSGGFGTMGRFSLELGIFAIIIGWITTTTTIHPVLAGGQANISAAIAVSVFYIILVPVCILPPIWSTHRAMVEYRDGLIKELSAKVNKSLQAALHSKKSNTAALLNSHQELIRLEELHNYVMRNTPTWPLAWFALRGFSIAAVMPVIINLVSIGVSLYRK